MRDLSTTLLAAQPEASRTPYLKVEVKNKSCGVVNYRWTRLYTGAEPDYYHALAICGDGALIRVRVTPPSDSRKLYRQRVANPDPGSDFSQWTYCNQYNVVVVAACALGAEASLFFIKSDRAIYRLKSTDNGVSWGSPELIDYSPTTAIYGIAAAYKPNGDLALFFADQATLYVKECISSVWQAKEAWDKSTGDLSGVASIYDADFNLFLTGKDSDGDYRLWSLVYGDGGAIAAGAWSDLKELARAPANGDFEYRQAFMAKPDVYRTFFVEKFSGTEAYNRPFWSHSVAGSQFTDSLWREPVPFNLSSEFGLAIACHDDYSWLSSPSGVWRAKLTEESLDLTADILSAKGELVPEQGRLVAELRNDDGRYTSPGSGTLTHLDIGSQLEVSPGYVTSLGNEVSPGLTFKIDDLEHTARGDKASLVLYTSDGWGSLGNWRARHQFRWNGAVEEMSVKDIIAFILARAGLYLEVKSASDTVSGYYPDFTIQPGDRGDSLIRRLLSFVPDVIFIEGSKAYLVNPVATDSSVYAYGVTHPVLEGHYRKGEWVPNRVQTEGSDPATGEAIIVDSFAWAEIERGYDLSSRIGDGNIDTAAEAVARGEASLRKAAIKSSGGAITVPVNCGQQLYDVINITDNRAGLDAEKKRVLGLSLVYSTRRGEYFQRLGLGAA